MYTCVHVFVHEVYLCIYVLVYIQWAESIVTVTCIHIIHVIELLFAHSSRVPTEQQGCQVPLRQLETSRHQLESAAKQRLSWNFIRLF